MPGEWTPLAVDFFEDPQVCQVGRDAALLYLAGLCYAQEHLTDGFIPDGAVRILAAKGWSKPTAARKLVDAGMWQPADGGYRVRAWSEWNKPADQVRKAREARQEGGMRGAHNRWHQNGRSDPACRWCTDSPTHGSTYNEPTSPGVAHGYPPSPSPSSLSSSGNSREATPSSDDNDREDPRIREALGIIADRRIPPGKSSGYRRTVLANLRCEDALDVDAARLCARYPTAPASLIAASLLGEDARNLQHYRTLEATP